MLDRSGREVAELRIWSAKRGEASKGDDTPLYEAPPEIAAAFGEQALQLRERERYEFQIFEEGKPSENLSLRDWGGVIQSKISPNAGTIETGDFCGTLPLQVCRADQSSDPIGGGLIEVRSVKMSYREDYRAMLDAIAKKSAALLLDSQSRTQLSLESDWSDDSPLIEQQLEFLRHTLESPEFRTAIDQILRSPHQRLERENEQRRVDQAGKIDRAIVRQLTRGSGDRLPLPTDHPASKQGLTSVPRYVEVARGRNDFDTAENRFVKMILEEFRDFLAGILAHLERGERSAIREPMRKDCEHLSSKLEKILGGEFFSQLSRPSTLPFGSPVLQRKTGYRELYHLWLQFHASSQLQWDGGPEIWHAGARNVATLYEYWLFFEMEQLFRIKFDCDAPLHSLLIENKKGIARMHLKRGTQLQTPVEGTWNQRTERPLKAQFMFNKKFAPQQDRSQQSSWTRGVQPDYTISIWPAEFDIEEAEAHELVVHVHFDAKYRVQELAGFEPPKEGDEALNHSTEAKYADLLKMHAYRDAIRRTGGAYVLYPGNSDHTPLKEFHEILPGLGAFSVKPSISDGSVGMEAVSQFLDQVIEHLSNRTTQYEQLRYHTGETMFLKEDSVPYNAIQLPERDDLRTSRVSPPPEEHKILVVWSKNDAQLSYWQNHEIAHVRLGDRGNKGELAISLELAEVRHLLFRRGKEIFGGLYQLTKSEFKVFTGAELKKKYNITASSPTGIYAVFPVQPDPRFGEQKWPVEGVWNAISKRHERLNPGQSLNPRRSADPRVMSLKELLATQLPE